MSKDPRVEDDDPEARPTPKQSGSFGIMSDICATTVSQLEAWLEVAPIGASSDVIKLIKEARELGLAVRMWEVAPPGEPKKRETIERILDMRERATKKADSYGHKLR